MPMGTGVRVAVNTHPMPVQRGSGHQRDTVAVASPTRPGSRRSSEAQPDGVILGDAAARLGPRTWYRPRRT
jgi:hypothetical protein